MGTSKGKEGKAKTLIVPLSRWFPNYISLHHAQVCLVCTMLLCWQICFQPPGHNLCPGVAGWAQRRFPPLCNASLLPVVWRPAQCCPEGIFDNFLITYLNKQYLLKNTLFQVIGGVVHLAGVFIVIVLLLLVHLAGVFQLSPLLQTSVAIPSLNLTRY